MSSVVFSVLWLCGSLCTLNNGFVQGALSSHPHLLGTDQRQGSCPNHFAEFFHRISLINHRNAVRDLASESDRKAWLSTSYQIFELSALLQGLNQTAKNETKTEAAPAPRFECKPNPDGLNSSSGGVILVNSSELVLRISHRPNATSGSGENATEDGAAAEGDGDEADSEKQSSLPNVCVVVMFYAMSCRFSAATAPEFNALGRAVTALDVLAFDISQSNGVNSRYGIVAVPSIVLFHNGKLAARFNETKRTLENMLGFIHNLTGLSYNASVTVSAEDHEGPIPTEAVIGPDYFLWFSNTFLVLCGLGLLQRKIGDAVRARVCAARDYVVQVWRTGEIYEQVGIADLEHEEPLIPQIPEVEEIR